MRHTHTQHNPALQKVSQFHFITEIFVSAELKQKGKKNTTTMLISEIPRLADIWMCVMY